MHARTRTHTHTHTRAFNIQATMSNSGFQALVCLTQNHLETYQNTRCQALRPEFLVQWVLDRAREMAFLLLVFNVYLLILRARGKGRERRRRERIPSRLRTVSTEPEEGLELTHREIMT